MNVKSHCLAYYSSDNTHIWTDSRARSKISQWFFIFQSTVGFLRTSRATSLLSEYFYLVRTKKLATNRIEVELNVTLSIVHITIATFFQFNQKPLAMSNTSNTRIWGNKSIICYSSFKIHTVKTNNGVLWILNPKQFEFRFFSFAFSNWKRKKRKKNENVESVKEGEAEEKWLQNVLNTKENKKTLYWK